MMRWLTMALCLVVLLGGCAPGSIPSPPEGSVSIAPVVPNDSIAASQIVAGTPATGLFPWLKVSAKTREDTAGYAKRSAIGTPPTISTGAATNITTNSVTVGGNLTSLGTATVVNVSFEYGTSTSYGRTTLAESMTGTGMLNASITDLSPGITYHFRAKADGGVNGIAIGDDVTFTTAVIPPTVTTSPATGITSNATTLNGNLTSLGTATTVIVSFEYGTTTSYGSTTIAQPMTGTGIFSANLTGLSSNVTYHFRAKAGGGQHGTATGADTTFTTLTPPAVSTSNATGITTESATVNGNLISLGTATTAIVFFEYGPTTNYGSTTIAEAMTGTGAFSANLTGLSPGTTYHFRAKADGGVHGIATSADMTFNTLASLTVGTGAATNIKINSATLNGNLLSLGTATTVSVFFEYGTTISYGSTTPAQVMTTPGAFNYNLPGLNPGTVYCFRAKVEGGEQGIATGTDMTFTTLTPLAISTEPATEVRTKSATLNANLLSLGEATTVNVFFEYGTSTSYGNMIPAQPRPGAPRAFYAPLVGLEPGITYHFRAKVDAGAYGKATGADVAFTTITPMNPVVDTTGSTNITASSAELRGDLTSLGSATTVYVFFEYGETTSYGSTTPAQTMMGTGAFSTIVTGLSPEVTYHFRAVADGGEHGIAIGADATFTTLKPVTPMVRSSLATNITSSAATLNGNLISLGNATSVNASFEYGVTMSYGNTTAPVSVNVTGTFSANLTSLNPGTAYHFRVKADGGAYGIAVGADMTFTTMTPIPPEVFTSPATGITSNATTLTGNLTSLGTAITGNIFFEYGTSSYGNTTAPLSVNVTGTFSANLTSLTPGTTYHFRAKVDGGMHGKATGADMTFTTLTPIPPVVDTVGSANVTTNAATTSGNLTSLGDASTVNIFFEYGTSTSYGNTTAPISVNVTGPFSANLTGLIPRTTYHFRAKADGGAYGRATGADMTFTTTTTGPVVDTATATNITANSATLSGNLTSLGTATDANVFFEYGTSTSYGNTTAPTSVNVTGPFSANITGLSSNTTYHFRAKADGGMHGTANGTDTTFTTLTPPTVITSTATNITTNSTTISGNLTSLGTATDVNVFFEYGTSTSYGNTTAPISVNATGPFSANLTGLTPGTTYHFRAKADGDVHGMATGADTTFTTGGGPEGAGGAGIGGGGGGGGLAVMEYTDKDGKKIEGAFGSSGKVLAEIKAYSTDSRLIITIPAGTSAQDKEGRPLSRLNITTEENPPPPQNNTSIIGPVYNFQPDGATFEPPMTLTWSYDPDDIPKGVSEKELFIAFWEENAGRWTALEGFNIDPVEHRVSVPVSHFTTFAIFCREPAAFGCGSLSIRPTETIIGETISISALVSNTGGMVGVYQLVLRINGLEEGREEVTVDAGASQEVSFTVTKNTAGTYQVDLNGRVGSFILKEKTVPQPPVPTPAAITISQLSVTPNKVNIGEKVTVSATVTNSGGTAGMYLIVMMINSMEEGRKEVTVDAGASKEVSFSVTKNIAGTYQVNLNRFASSFTVEGKAANNWWLFAVASLGAVLICSVIYLLVRRRKRVVVGLIASDALAHYERGEYDEAIIDYTKAINLDPNRAYFYDNRGSAYFIMGKWDEAIADYNRAIALDLSYAKAYYDRGVVYRLLGQRIQAMADFDMVIKLQLDPELSQMAKRVLEELQENG